MPIIKSAKKRVRVARKATVRNAKTKRSLKTALKSFHASLTGKKASEAHSKAQSAVDKAAKKGIMHKNKAARKKRQLAAKLKAAGVKPTSVTKKTQPKKSTTTRPAVKKTAVRKTSAKNKTTKK